VEANDPSRSGTLSAIRSIATAVKDATAGASEGTENIDPAIQAAKELGGIFSPVKALVRPLGGLFGRSKEAKEAKQHREQVTWLRRIWRGQADAGKRSGGGGLLRVLGMLLPLLGLLLAPIKALGRLTGLTKLLGAAAGLGRSVFSGGRRGAPGRRGGFWRRKGPDAPGGPRHSERTRIGADGLGRSERATTRSERPGRPGAGGRGRVGNALSKAGGLLGSAGSLLKGGAGTLLKKVPVLGALIGGGMLASSLMQDAKTPEEKKDKYGSVGSAAGGLVGGALGLIGGPAGVIAGGYIGEYIGEKVGTWLATADLRAMTDSVTGIFGEMADTAGGLAKSAYEYVSKTWSGMIDSGIKLFTDMKGWVGDKLDWIGDKLTEAKDAVKDKVQDVSYAVRDSVSSGAATVADKGKNLLNTVTGGRYTGGSNAAKGEMISAMAEAGITDHKSQAALMANVDNETGGFKRFDENLNYSAERLQKIFPKYYKTADAARADAGNPEAIANRVYGGRMGNNDPGDGYKYRGRGMIQLTGKNQYESMSKKVGVDLVANPDLAADPKIAAKIAAEYWKSSGADKAAQAGDYAKARKIVNGGSIGLEETLAKTGAYLEQANAGELTAPQTADKSKAQAPAAAQKAMSGTLAAMHGKPQPGPIGVLAPAAASATPAPTAGVASPATAPAVAQSLKPAAATPVSPATPAVPAATLAAPPAVAAPVAPAVPETVKSISYQPPAADAATTKVPATPEVRTPPPASSSAGPATSQPLAPLTQNLPDRQIAHVASGGLGMGLAQL